MAAAVLDAPARAAAAEVSFDPMRTSAKLGVTVLLSFAWGCGTPPATPPTTATAAVAPPVPSSSSSAIPRPTASSAPPPPPERIPPPPPATFVPAGVGGVRARPPGPPPKGSTTERVTIPTDGRATVLGLEIQVRENIEKRDMDGSSLMRIQLHVKAGPDETDVALSSQEVFAAWKRYEIEYAGGWRQDLTLKITRLP